MIYCSSCAEIIARAWGRHLLRIAFMAICICAKLGHGEDAALKASPEVEAAQILMERGWSLRWERSESALHVTGVAKVGDVDRRDLPRLSKLPFLRSIQLKYTYNSAPCRWPTLSGEDLSFLHGAERLESLVLARVYVDTSELAKSLRTSTRLRRLVVTVARLANRTVINLKQLPAVDELAVIVVEKESAAALQSLLRCDSLTSVALLTNAQNCVPPRCFTSGRPTDQLVLRDAAIGNVERDFLGLHHLRRMVLLGCCALDDDGPMALLSTKGISELVMSDCSFPVGLPVHAGATNDGPPSSDLTSLDSLRPKTARGRELGGGG
jgi:hypothetical protein